MINAEYVNYPKYEMIETCCPYEILESIYYSTLDVHIYIVKDSCSGKCNVYFIEDDVSNWYKYIQFIVECYKPLDLSHAKFCFPHYNFSKENYGF